MYGIMNKDVHGTELNTRLYKGEEVNVFIASNLPEDSKFKYFVSPSGGSWGDYTLAVYEDDVTITVN